MDNESAKKWQTMVSNECHVDDPMNVLVDDQMYFLIDDHCIKWKTNLLRSKWFHDIRSIFMWKCSSRVILRICPWSTWDVACDVFINYDIFLRCSKRLTSQRWAPATTLLSNEEVIIAFKLKVLFSFDAGATSYCVEAFTWQKYRNRWKLM